MDEASAPALCMALLLGGRILPGLFPSLANRNTPKTFTLNFTSPKDFYHHSTPSKHISGYASVLCCVLCRAVPRCAVPRCRAVLCRCAAPRCAVPRCAALKCIVAVFLKNHLWTVGGTATLLNVRSVRDAVARWVGAAGRELHNIIITRAPPQRCNYAGPWAIG